jgi:hypothetical protein
VPALKQKDTCFCFTVLPTGPEVSLSSVGYIKVSVDFLAAPQE